jgi:putative addiction module component (TIGR02574 family)
MSPVEVLLQEAIQLRPAEKAMLVDGIMDSLDHPDSEISRLWIEEAERRYDAYKAGLMSFVSEEELFGANR